jgi:surface carbohydrate biosynthesis protein
MKKKTVYIAIEIKVREFISQILLASKLIKKDYRVYLGAKDQILYMIKNKKEKGGIFFYKAGVPERYVDLVEKKTDAHAVFDQELMPGISKKREYLESVNCFTKKGLKFIDMYFAVNKTVHQCAKKELRNIRGNIYLTGSPRIDLWRKKYHHLFYDEVNKIKKKHGDFYLFNSDFQYVTKNIEEEALEFLKPQDFKVWSGSRFKNTIPKRLKMARKLNEEFDEFIPFIISLQKKTNKKIIIRPHPAENKYVWKSIFAKHKNIIIEDPKIDVFAWILASKGVLHRGCTTSLQSLYVQKPTFFIDLGKKFKQNYIYKKMSYDYSKKITKENLNNLDMRYTDKTKKNFTFLNNLGIEKNESANKIASIFKKYQIKKEEKIKIKIQNSLLTNSKLLIKRIMYNIFSLIFFKNKKKLNRFEKIYNGITSREVNYYLKKLNPKEVFRVEQAISNVVLIEKNKY